MSSRFDRMPGYGGEPEEARPDEDIEANQEDGPEMYRTDSPEWRQAEEELAAQDIFDMILLMKAALERRLADSRRETKSERRYRFFTLEDEREELVRYCAAIAEYLKDENVTNLIVTDRSARPLYVGVREYWKAKYPEEAPPNIKFMNPKGFKDRDSLSPRELDDIAMDAYFKNDAVEPPYRARSQEAILAELQQTYRELMKDKDKPVMVFDTCIHSGESLRPMIEALTEAGFADIRVGAVTPADRRSRVKTDFHITGSVPTKGCYPFDRDRMVEKTFDHVYSLRNYDPEERKRSIALRQEIRAIMQDYLKEAEDRAPEESSD